MSAKLGRCCFSMFIGVDNSANPGPRDLFRAKILSVSRVIFDQFCVGGKNLKTQQPRDRYEGVADVSSFCASSETTFCLR